MRSSVRPPIGLVIVTVGIVYMVLIGQRFLPDHKEESPIAAYGLRDFLSEIVVLPESPLIGQTSDEWELPGLDLRILGVIRGEERIGSHAHVIFEEGDTLLVEGQVDTLMKLKKIEGVEIRGKLDLDKLCVGSSSKIVEVLIAPQSNLIGRTLKEADFTKRFGLPVLAIHRHGQPLREKIGDVRLLLGDLLLAEGPADRVDLLRGIGGLVILDEHWRPAGKIRRGLIAAGAFAAAIGAGAVGWLPLSIALLCAALLTVLLRCISIEKARAVIDLRLLLLIGGMTAFGTAMEKTGAAPLLAHWVVAALSPFGVMTVMGGFFVLTIVLTQPMSNAAAALVVLARGDERGAGVGCLGADVWNCYHARRLDLVHHSP